MPRAACFAVAFGLAALSPPLAAQTFRATSMAGKTKLLTPGLFSTSCGTGEVVAGIYGRASTYVDQIGAYCVRVTATGAWSGEVRATGTYGGGGGSSFDHKCNRNHALYGFRGRHGWYVDRIEIRCRPLTSPTSVSGTTYYKPPAGGTNGSTFGPYNCPDNKPAFGFGGQAVSWIDMLYFMCRP